ncbi:MAG: ZIP family metal transporter [Clostridia bacterium]|nr:ZIP family metal transporter [Clostridia bacterium]
MNNASLTILGILLIFLATTAGAALVFFFKKDISEKLNTAFLGFAAGIMIAASVWSLLIPSIEDSSSWGKWSFVPAVVGFILGGLFLVVLDKVVPHFHVGTGKEEGPGTSLRKPVKMFLAVTIHNVPEGLAVGFAFGGAAVIGAREAFLSALGLAIGIAIQNFPEGAAVSLPLKNATGSNAKSFLFGMGSGAVEPIAAIIGYFLATSLSVAQPWLLAFAAGAMIFVVAEDLIPDAKLSEHSHLGTWGVMIGFAVMMALDVAFG